MNLEAECKWACVPIKEESRDYRPPPPPFFFFFFFFKKTKPANSEQRRRSVPASLADCRVQQTSLVLLENNYRAPRPSLAPASGSFGPISGFFRFKARE